MNKDQPWLQYLSWSREYGELVYVSVAGKKLLFLNSKKAAHDLLDLQADVSSNRPDMPMMYLLGWDHILGMMKYGNYWRAHNRLLGRHFHATSIPKYHPALTRATTLLLKEILFDPKSFAQSVRTSTAAFIISIIYGHDIAPFSSDKYVSLAEAAMESFSAAGNPGAFYVDLFPSLMYIPEWLMPSWAFKKKASLWQPIVTYFKEKPYEIIRESMRDGTAKPCIATKMIVDELDTAPADELEARENVVKNCMASAYAGGSDTTVSTLTSFFMLMALHPEIQRRAQQELDKVLAEGSMPDFSDRPRLPYIEALCRELFRWHPVAPQGVAHCADADIIYNGYIIPKGTTLIGNSWAILHGEDVYPDRPFEFVPERFLDSQGKLDESVFHPFRAVFGFGRRICPGRHAADANVWITVASVLRVYEISRDVDETGEPVLLTPEFSSGITSHPKQFLCNIKPRSEVHKAMIDALELGDGYILE